MRGRKCHVGQEGLAVTTAFFNELNGFIGEILRRIVILGQFLNRLPVFCVRSFRDLPFDVPTVIEVIGGSDEQGEIALEATSVRYFVRFHSEMPFPGHVSVIAAISQQRGDRGNALVKHTFVPRLSYLVRR